MLLIFAKLNKIYPGKWAGQFESPEIQDNYIIEWMEGLSGFTGDQMTRAIKECRLNSDWPPSISKFRKFGLGDAGLWQHQGAAYKTHQKALPKPRNANIAKSAIAGLRAAL